MGTKGRFVRCRGIPALSMALLLLISLCTGCGAKVIDGAPETDPRQKVIKSSDEGPEMVSEYNVVLVLDASGSMNTSDPGRRAFDAASMFLDTLYISNAGGERQDGVPVANANVVWYNDEVDCAYDTGVPKLSTAGAVEKLKSKIYNIYPTGFPREAEDSALGKAIAKAVEMLPEPDMTGPGFAPPPNMGANPDPMSSSGGPGPGGPGPGGPGPSGTRNMIVLFTDGITGYRERQRPEETPEGMPYIGGNGQQTLESALEKAKNYQYEIYVIGLNVEAMGDSWDALKMLADYTQEDMGRPGPPPDMQGSPDQTQALPSFQMMNGNNLDGQVPGSPPPAGPDGFMPPPPPPGPMMTGSLSGVFKDPDASTNDPSARGVNWYSASTVVYVQRAYVCLTAAMMQQGKEPVALDANHDTDWSYFTMRVDTSGNSAAVIYILSDTTITGMKLERMNNSGDVVESFNLKKNTKELNFWNPDQTVRLLWYKGYSTLAIMDPEPGQWRMGAQGNDKSFQAYGILIGGITMSINVQQTAANPGMGVVTIKAEYQGRNMDSDYYLSMLKNCQCFYMKEPDGPPQMGEPPLGSLQGMSMGQNEMPAPPPAGPMDGMPPLPPGAVLIENIKYDESAGVLTGSFSAPTPGRYRVEFRMRSSDTNAEYAPKSAMIDMQPGPHQEIFIKRVPRTYPIKKITMPGWESTELKAVDWRLDSSYGEIVLVESQNDGASLLLTSQESGYGYLYVTVESLSEDTQGRQWQIVYPIGVAQHVPEDQPIAAAGPQDSGFIPGPAAGPADNQSDSSS